MYCMKTQFIEENNVFRISAITKRNFHVLIYSFWTWCAHRTGNEGSLQVHVYTFYSLVQYIFEPHSLWIYMFLCVCLWFVSFSCSLAFRFSHLSRRFLFSSTSLNFFFLFFCFSQSVFFYFFTFGFLFGLHIASTFHAFCNESEIISTGAFLFNDGYVRHGFFSASLRMVHTLKWIQMMKYNMHSTKLLSMQIESKFRFKNVGSTVR